jgi:hypothetical protein
MTTTSAPRIDASDPNVDAGYPLEVPAQPNGPMVTALLRRTGIAAGIAAGTALAATIVFKRPGVRAVALGALTPGAGYAYTRNPLRLLATLVTFAVSLVAWFATGNIIAPPAIWAAAAIDAGRRASSGRKTWRGALVAVPVALAMGLVGGSVARRKAFKAAQERGAERARYLADVPRLDPRPSDRPQAELSQADLAAQRGFLDRALQPLDRFDGFDQIEQFQTSAIRYQIYMAHWTLAMSQLHHVPSFHGYLSAAQRQLTDKLTLPKVWRYWAFEQTWGNLSLDWDPMRKDNVMLSGYLGVMLGAYESNTGDNRYRRRGSLPFRLAGRTWAYDHDMVNHAVYDNMVKSPMTMFPCEPNWIYNMCNMTAINTVLLSDRLHGTRYYEQVGEDFTRKLREEFVTADGRVTAIRSARLGFTIPMLTSTLADCALVSMAQAFDPELAQRCWSIVRREFIDTTGPEPTIALRGWDAIDTGNYKKSNSAAYGAVMWAAAEMGDSELYGILKESLDRRMPAVMSNGASWYGPSASSEGASTQVNAMLGVARFSPPGGYRALILDGPGEDTLTGPVLEEAAYPDVLVASARSDGSDLRLVLRPGNGARRTGLGIHRLRPSARYAVSGALADTVTADDRGVARIEVDLDARVEVALAPAN